MNNTIKELFKKLPSHVQEYWNKALKRESFKKYIPVIRRIIFSSEEGGRFYYFTTIGEVGIVYFTKEDVSEKQIWTNDIKIINEILAEEKGR